MTALKVTSLTLIAVMTQFFADPGQACQPKLPQFANIFANATYIPCLDISTGVVKCVEKGSSDCQTSPNLEHDLYDSGYDSGTQSNFLSYDSVIYSDIISCNAAVTTLPYYFIARTGLMYANKDDAKAACEIDGAKLATVKTQEQLGWLNEAIKINSNLLTPFSTFWIDLEYSPSDGAWVWSDDKSKATVTNWNEETYCDPGDTCRAMDHAMVVGYYGWKWGNFPSTRTVPAYAMCFGRPAGRMPNQPSGKLYLMSHPITGYNTRSLAISACSSTNNGVVASLRTHDEILEASTVIAKAYIFQQHKPCYFFWLNLEYNGTQWVWQDRGNLTAVGENYWFLGGPNAPFNVVNQPTLKCASAQFRVGTWANHACNIPINSFTNHYCALCMKRS